jgi:hypothetical protein
MPPRSQNSTGDAGRYSRSFGLSASVCIAALRRVEKPTASPQRSPVSESLALGRPQIPGQLSAPVRPGGSLTEAKCWAVRFPEGRGGRPAPTEPNKNEIDRRKVVVGALGGGSPLALIQTGAEQEASLQRAVGISAFCWRDFGGRSLNDTPLKRK